MEGTEGNGEVHSVRWFALNFWWVCFSRPSYRTLRCTSASVQERARMPRASTRSCPLPALLPPSMDRSILLLLLLLLAVAGLLLLAVAGRLAGALLLQVADQEGWRDHE